MRLDELKKRHSRLTVGLLILLRTGLRAIRDIDGFFSTYTRRIFPQKFTLSGRCRQDGRCCQCIAIYLSDEYWQSARLKRWIVLWYEFVNNFEFLQEEADLQYLVFRCHYSKNGHCQIYWRRPFLCRNYPLRRYFDEPIFLPDCGFSARCKR